MKWVGLILALVVLTYVCVTSYGLFRAFGSVDHSSVLVARAKLPAASKWISTLTNLKDGQELILPPDLKGMIGPGGSVRVRQYDKDVWVVFECFVEDIDNGEGYAYCLKPDKDSIPVFVEQQLAAKRIDQNWVWFRFT
ncbi:MAG: hypothetical protein WCG75_08100 [Armatimonadota bacterium]